MRRALEGIDRRCVLEPLKSSIAKMQLKAQRDEVNSTGADQSSSLIAGAVIACLVLWVGGCACGLLFQWLLARKRQPRPAKKLIEVTLSQPDGIRPLEDAATIPRGKSASLAASSRALSTPAMQGDPPPSAPHA